MSAIQFGTDGWRAIIAEDFTFANVARVTQASADYWSANPVRGTSRTVVIGYDRRFLSDQFARCAAEVFAGNDFKVILTPCPTPTPSVSYAVKNLKAIGGVMITASHNPPEFNGFKLKSHYGGPSDPETCKAVEQWLDRSPLRRTPLEIALKQRSVVFKDLRPAHFTALKRLVDYRRIARSGLRFAHEALFGVGAGCFETLLAGTSCRVTTINAQHDPFFGGINPEPIERNYRLSRKFLRAHPHDFCLVTDGDADRVGGMDGRGGYLSTHQIICLLLHHCIHHRAGKGRVVKALTTTSMLDKMCEANGLVLTETSVGFKHICAEILKGGVLLGGEESGGIGFPQLMPERDGIAAGMMMLELLASERAGITRLIARLEREFGPHHYDRVDLHYPLNRREALMEFLKQHPPVTLLKSPVTALKTFDGVKAVAANGSWLMWRGSGTEPVLRIYAEAASAAGMRTLLKQGQASAAAALD
jgi:phosphomannomutase